RIAWPYCHAGTDTCENQSHFAARNHADPDRKAIETATDNSETAKQFADDGAAISSPPKARAEASPRLERSTCNPISTKNNGTNTSESGVRSSRKVISAAPGRTPTP